MPASALLLAVALLAGGEPPPAADKRGATPVVGGLLGEGRFRLHRWLSVRGASPWLLFALDPLGESERRFLRTRC